MALDYQVTVDARDPHTLARFWAQALGFEVQDYTEMIRSLLDQGVAREEDVVEFDGMLLWRVGAAVIDPPTGRRVLFMRVDEPTPGKNTWHLDLNVGRDNIDAEVARLTTLGAMERYKIDEPGAFHTTMADPEGNLFCVQ